MKTQYYVDSLPTPPKDPGTQKIVPITEKAPAIMGWQLVVENDRILGLKNPKLGQFIHSTVVDGEKALYDLVVWDDGPIGPDGLATAGSVVAPIEKKDGQYFVHCFWQWRPAYQQWTLTIPGGFASYIGESPEAVARREAMEEGGIHILSYTSKASSANRANVRTLTNVGFAEFEVVSGHKLTDEAEKIVGAMAIRIDKFPWTPDRFTNEAIVLAAQELGLLRPSPIGDVKKAISDLKRLIG